MNTTWVIAIGLTAFVSLTHIFAPRILDSTLLNRTSSRQDAIASFAGGVAIAYVFVHLLPELADGEEAFNLAGLTGALPDLFIQSSLFFVALIGLVTFYFLDAKAESKPNSSKQLYRIHLGMIALLSLIFAYTNFDRIEIGADFAVLFAVVMSLHFILTDRGMARAHPKHFRREDRWLLSAALALGLLLSFIAPPPNELWVAIPTGFLGGAVLMGVFREELPSVKVARLGWFAFAVVSFSSLLIWASYTTL